jgi:peptidoglycan hydrolase CwlO-like protein
MENLPAIQTTLNQWLQLTMNNLLYVAVLVFSVWLFTALMYSIIIAGLNKKNAASENARTRAEANLNTAQQQLQQAQTELATLTEQLAQHQQAADAEKQRALASEQQHAQRNQQIAAIVQRLASSFDIGERPVHVIDNLKADDLWQQHDKVISKLIEALRTEQQAKTELEKFYQAEKTKVAETQTQLVSLQTNLDSQTSLVLALQTQTTALQQQQNDTQRDLTDALRKHQTDLARLLQLEQQATQFTHTQARLDTAPIAPAPVPEPVVSPSVAVDEATTKIQDLFKKPQQPSAPATPENEVMPLVQTTVEQVVEQPEVAPAPPVIKPEPLATVEPIAETPEKTSKVSALKGMYQKFTTSKAAQAEPAPVEVVEETPEKTSKKSALKGLYQKFTPSKAEQVEATPAVPVAEPEPILLVTEPTPVPVIKLDAVVEEVPEKPSNIGQLKGLYQKYTKAKTHEKELAPESFDDSSSSLEDKADQITEKLEQMKNLYGKFFSKNK